MSGGGFPFFPLDAPSDAQELRRLRRELEDLKRRRPREGKFVWKVFPDHFPDRWGDASIVIAGDGQLIKAVAEDIGDPQTRLDRVAAFITTAGTTDLVVMLRNVTTGHDMLSSPITIAGGDFYANNATIDDDQSLVSEGDLIAVDIDADGGGTAEGLGVITYFR